MASTASSEFRAQFTHPSDTFSILLIVGGDVIQLALANLTGAVMTPVAFSFGWVAYAVTAVLSAIGDNRLVSCAPEVPLKVFDLHSGYGRDNQSWLLGRLLKTYDSWMPAEVRAKMGHAPAPASLPPRRGDDKEAAAEAGQGAHGEQQQHPPPRIALCAAVYTWQRAAGKPTLDTLWWSGLLVTAVQLIVAALPLALHGNWAILLAASAGTVLAYATASLPHWRAEKYMARRGHGGQDFALTQGQGSRHVLVVLGDHHRAGRGEGAEGEACGWGLNLADLAGGRAPDMAGTRIWATVLAVLWLVLLVACTGIVSHTWYLLGVGGLGMLHNLLSAGWPRRPEALGLPIALARTDANGKEDETQVFAEAKAMWTLMELELEYAGFGKALLTEFFPGPLKEWEKEWWRDDDHNRRRVELDAQKRQFEVKAVSKAGNGKHI